MSHARGRRHPPAAVVPLLDALADPVACALHDEAQWDRLIRLARNARLLGVLAHRVLAAGDATRIPGRVRRHLQAGLIESRFRRQKTHHLLHLIAPALHGHAGPWVLLKGAAYIVQELPLSQGRIPGDVDLMVPRGALDGIERALLDAGWEFDRTSAYDQHYYRAWSHELPPLQAAGMPMELDLHHTILPPVGRIRPDTAALFADAMPIAGSRFHVLSRHDQVLHAIVHLVQDSDFTGRLRDLVDIDGLLRALPLTDPSQRAQLVDRAERHGMKAPLGLAAVLCRDWFGTPGCAELADGDASLLHGRAVAEFATRVLGPIDVGHPRDGAARGAQRLLGLREHWLRMPPWLLAWHATAKGARNLAARFRSAHAPS